MLYSSLSASIKYIFSLIFYYWYTDEVDSAKKELEQESAKRTEVETKLRETESLLKASQSKSKAFILKMQEKLEDVDRKRVSYY